MSGKATLTMNMSRPATNVATETMRSTRVRCMAKRIAQLLHATPLPTLRDVLKRTYDGQRCSIAGTLEIVGERWTLLILRDAFLGVRRFEDFQRRNGIARNVLAGRLQRLVDEDVLRREPYSEHPPRNEYRLTDKGLDLWPAVFALMQWGDRYVNAGEPPLRLTHRDCGGDIDAHRRCVRCGADIGPRDVVATPAAA